MKQKQLPTIMFGSRTYYIDKKHKLLRNVNDATDTMPLSERLSDAIAKKQQQTKTKKRKEIS